MTKDQNQLFKSLLGTCRDEFYRHAFPQAKTQDTVILGARAFLEASLSRAGTAAKLLGFEKDPKAAYEVLSTTPSIVNGLRAYHDGKGPSDLMEQLRKAQAKHLQNRDLDRPVVKALSEFIDCRTLPDTKVRVHEFGF